MLGRLGVVLGRKWVALDICKAFWIPTCWYCQRESLVLGVLPNVKPQCKGVHFAVESRLNIDKTICVRFALYLRLGNKPMQR